MTVSEVVLAERDGAVGIARLNRPEARNALSADLMERLVEVIEDWDADTELRAANVVFAESGVALASLLRLDPRFEKVYEYEQAAIFVRKRGR